MDNTIHIFFNAHGSHLPPNNNWENFMGHDEIRVFNACAESWRLHGWNVKRLVSSGGDFFKTGGELEKSFGWYPPIYWNFWREALRLCDTMGDDEKLHFGTYDVFNFGLYPDDYDNYIIKEMTEDNIDCVYSQIEHFSLSFFSCKVKWISHAIRTINRYNNGTLNLIDRPYVSDETILREHAQKTYGLNLQRYANNTSKTAPLVHFARSTLRSNLAEYPIS